MREGLINKEVITNRYQIKSESVSSLINGLDRGATIQFIVVEGKIIVGQKGRFHHDIEMDNSLMEEEIQARGSVFLKDGVPHFIYRDQTIDTFEASKTLRDFLIRQGVGQKETAA